MRIYSFYAGRQAPITEQRAGTNLSRSLGRRVKHDPRTQVAGCRQVSSSALRSPSDSDKMGPSKPLVQPQTNSRRRPSRSWIDELTAEIVKYQSDLLIAKDDLVKSKSDLVAAKDELFASLVASKEDLVASKNDLVLAKSDLAEARNEVVRAKDQLAVAVKAQVEAERLALDRLRELGMVNARGIIEWAEVRARNLHPDWTSLSRFSLWTKIIQSDPELQKCLIRAGWENGTLSSNMVGLYASLSSDIHKDSTPEVSQAIGGVVISVTDVGSGVNATAGKVLVCVARSNYIKASLRGKNGNDLEISQGLDVPDAMEAYQAEKNPPRPTLPGA